MKTLIDEIISHRQKVEESKQMKDEKDKLEEQLKIAEEKMKNLHGEVICQRRNCDEVQKNLSLQQEVDNLLQKQVDEQKRQVETMRHNQFMDRPNMATVQPSLNLGDELPPLME